MKARFSFGWALLAALFTFSACDESTEDLGSSLTNLHDQLNVSNQVFQVTSRSVSAGSVWARSNVSYLGCVKDPETGGYVTSHFMTQFYMLEDEQFSQDAAYVTHDEDGNIVADSCEIRLFYKTYYGDPLATMKLGIYELDHPMTEDQHYESDFDPFAEGYIRSGGIEKQVTYTLINYTDDDRDDDDYADNICIKLNDPYTDKNGVTYSNYGTYVLRTFESHPEYFKNTMMFMHHVVPGFYITHKGGIGSMVQVLYPQLNVFFHSNKDGEETDLLLKFSGTEEVLQSCMVVNDESTINDMVADNSCTYLKTPTGIFTELTLPVDEIFTNHDKDTINSASLSLTRLNNTEHDQWSFNVPSTLLMVEKDSLYNFFDKRSLADNKQSYLSSYSSALNSYTYSNISGLVRHMAIAKQEGLRTNPNWLSEHPNWNKVVVVPIVPSYRTYTDSYGRSYQVLIGVTHDMSLGFTRLCGGSTPIELSVIYSKFKE
ncbi:MAG: DUF4270 domain-containing protein [Prevotella sp.]|nr:DUF4270 domain-containing protein [Prevotella sp.]